MKIVKESRVDFVVEEQLYSFIATKNNLQRHSGTHKEYEFNQQISVLLNFIDFQK